MEKSIETLKTFIFIHDQDILLDFLNKKKFFDLDNFDWVFLGNRPINKLSNVENLIIARDLPNNIEIYPKFTSLTGWYALYKNNLLNSEYVNFFEYDIKYVPNFKEINLEICKKNFDFVGYFPMSVRDVVYIQYTQYSSELINAVKNQTSFDIIDMIKNLPSNAHWSSSSNSTWKTEKLINYLDWFIPYIDDLKQSKFCGHIHERSISFYYFMEKLKVHLTKGLMIHAQLNSHGTSPLPPERAKQMYNLL